MTRLKWSIPLAVITLSVGASLPSAASDLSKAVERQACFQAERLLRAGADPNELLDGKPILVHAVRAENFELCRLLLLHGANPNIDAETGDEFLTLLPNDNREQLAIQILLRTYRFLQSCTRASRSAIPRQPGLVILAEPTIDYTHPEIAPNYYINEAERAGQNGVDDDGDGFKDNIYGWGMVTDQAHVINHWQRQLYCSDSKLIAELVELHNRVESGAMSVTDGAYRKLHTTFRNPVAALFGASSGFTDAKFLDAVVELSHGSHVAGTVIHASGGKAKVHTLSWDNFGQHTDGELGYPPITSGDPIAWLTAVRQHRFPRLIAMGQRCSDYLRTVDASIVNASFHISFEGKVSRAIHFVEAMRLFDEKLPADTITLVANELYAYDTIPCLIAVAENPQMLFIAAAGNDHHNIDASFDAPAFLSRLFQNVIAVAATGVDGRLTSFSSFGRKSVNLAAPGENIESFGVAGTRIIMSGTSMAAPAVAGVAAKYRVAHPECEAAKLARLIELGATLKPDQARLSVSSSGLLDEDALAAIAGGDSSALVELAWRLIDSNPAHRPEVWADAMDLFDAALGRHFDHVDLWWSTAALRDQVGLESQALLAIDRALELDKRRPELWLSRCLILFRLNEFAKVSSLAVDFEKTFPSKDSKRLASIRRDVMALGIAAAQARRASTDVERLTSLYEASVAAVGRADGVGKPFVEAEVWHVNGNLRSVLLPADEPIVVHRYFLKSNGLDKLQVDLRSSDFDTFLAIKSLSGPLVENDDFNGQIDHSQIVIENPEAGEHLVIVASLRGRDVGAYRLDVTGAALSLFDDGIVVPKQHRRLSNELEASK